MSTSVVSDEPRVPSPPSAPKSVRKEGGFEQKIPRLPLNPIPTNKSAAPDLNRQLPPNSLSVIAAKRAQLADLAYPSPKRMLSLCPTLPFLSAQSVICSGIERLHLPALPSTQGTGTIRHLLRHRQSAPLQTPFSLPTGRISSALRYCSSLHKNCK